MRETNDDRPTTHREMLDCKSMEELVVEFIPLLLHTRRAQCLRDGRHAFALPTPANFHRTGMCSFQRVGLFRAGKTQGGLFGLPLRAFNEQEGHLAAPFFPPLTALSPGSYNPFTFLPTTG
jgi:hypothetical protein